MTKKKTVTLIVVSVIVVAIVVVFAVLIRGQKVSDYTVDEHVARITERANERYVKKERYKERYTGCSVYPLYDENDNFANFCVIELQPQGYVFIQINDVNLLFRIFGSNGMYGRCNEPLDSWSRYRIAKDGNTETIIDSGIQWSYHESYIKNALFETDSDGERIYHTDSPYRFANVGDEKRYFLKVGKHYYVPAIKSGDKFINLISMEEFECDSEVDYDTYPCMLCGVSPKNDHDL